jgi:hypothetical protein
MVRHNFGAVGLQVYYFFKSAIIKLSIKTMLVGNPGERSETFPTETTATRKEDDNLPPQDLSGDEYEDPRLHTQKSEPSKASIIVAMHRFFFHYDDHCGNTPGSRHNGHAIHCEKLGLSCHYRCFHYFFCSQPIQLRATAQEQKFGEA